jgi:hypothetical protein
MRRSGRAAVVDCRFVAAEAIESNRRNRCHEGLQSSVVRGMRYRGIATALSAVAVAGVLAAAGLASGYPLRGRYYDGKPTSTAGGTSLALDFRSPATVTRSSTCT